MKRNVIFNGLLLSLIAINFSACICRSSLNQYHFRADRAKNLMPTINDTLRYINALNNVHEFTMVSSLNELYLGPCDDCCTGGGDEFERRRILYDTDQLTFKIEFEANSTFQRDELTLQYQSKLPLNILYYNENYSFVENVDIVSVVNHTNSAVAFADSMALNNKMYYNVYTFSHALNTTKYYLTDLYYTPTQGMVGYKVSDGSTYVLVD